MTPFDTVTSLQNPAATAKKVMQRRSVLKLGAASAGVLAFSPAARAQQEPIKIGVTVDLSSVEKSTGAGIVQGTKAYFQKLNQAGGIDGRKVEVLVLDDTFKPEVSKTNAEKLVEANVVAILSPLGTRQAGAVMDAVPGVAVVGPYTGTVTLRKKPAPHTFFIRANYDQEVDKLIATAMAQGITKIGLVHPVDPLGQSVLAAFNVSMAKAGIKPVVIATTPGTISPEVGPAAEAIAKAEPQVVIVCLGGTAALFIQALRKAGNNSTVYGLSLAATAANIQKLGPLSRGLGLSIVVPSPFSQKFEVVRQYRLDMQASGVTELALTSMEGYINARVLGEALRKAGRGVTRQTLLASLEKIEGLDLGGLRISYGAGNREGGNFVDVAVVAVDGQLRT